MNGDTLRPHRVVPPSRRRDKPVLSCTLCRRRKLKCDRRQPCQSCVQRGLAVSCTYVQQSNYGSNQGSKAPESVHDRIDQLEKLVTTLMNQKTSEVSSPTPSQQPLSISAVSSEVPDTPDRVEVDDDATSYTNSSHWTNILDGITELRDELDRVGIVSPHQCSGPDTPGPDLLFGRQKYATKTDILAGIPPKAESDDLIDKYFASLDMASALLHRPTFMAEYDKFWERPFETPVMWLALLFSLFAISTRFQAVIQDPNLLYSRHSHSLYSARLCLYREKAAQCLILADYSKCPRYTVEALLHYCITEYFRSQDAQCGLYMLVGIVVRAAFRMGYHRDPSRFPNISPFEGEMRRRLWIMLIQLDLMTSSQVGLPRMLQPSVYDVAEPRNLIEEDLYEEMTELPASRPDTEPTVMLYTLARTHVLHVFSRIVDLTNSTTYPPYQEILQLDKELQEVADGLPSSIKIISVKDFDITDGRTALRRLFLGLSFLKARLTLHRPFLILGRTDQNFEYARLTCINTALEMLECQQKLYTEGRDGRLATENWHLWTTTWRFSSVVNHHFLLATTVLSLELDKDLMSPAPVVAYDGSNHGGSNATPSRRAEIIAALQNSYKVWSEQCENSREARKVAAAVRLVLRKANVDVESDSHPTSYDTPTPPSMSESALFTPHQPQGLEIPGGNSPFFGIDNPHFVPPLLTNDLFMDIPDLDWVGMDTNMFFDSNQSGLGDNYHL